MEKAKANNEIKWLLLDQMTDLTAAVCMGQDFLKAYSDGKLTLIQIMTRLRAVCSESAS